MTIACALELLADILQEIERGPVFAGGDKFCNHPVYSACRSNLAEAREHTMFYLAAESAAAQEQRVNCQDGTIERIQNRSNQAVIAKAVAEAHYQALSAALEKTPKLRFTPPDSREVKLVGALG